MSDHKENRALKLVVRRGLSPIVLPLFLFLSGCGVRALDPAGPAASAIANLWWVMLVVSVAIFTGVVIVLALALWHRRTDADRDRRLGRRLVTIGGVVIPAVTVLGLMIYNTYISVYLEEPPTTPATAIEVESHRWWWEVRYADFDFATANEIHIPVGQAVLLRLHSDDVIHALWVPELHGKRDMMPDHTGTMWLQADEPGKYRGMCAEFCGKQHAKMQFLVFAHEPAAYEAWLVEQQVPPPKPTTDQALRGQQIFLNSGCADCHRVAGTDAAGTLGPDLTNLSSRRELGAGTLPNTRANLAAWIIDAQQFKPGNLMPPVPMSDQDLQDLLTYLDTLR